MCSKVDKLLNVFPKSGIIYFETVIGFKLGSFPTKVRDTLFSSTIGPPNDIGRKIKGKISNGQGCCP